VTVLHESVMKSRDLTGGPGGGAVRDCQSRLPAPHGLPEDNADVILLGKAIQRAGDGDRDALTFLYVRYADKHLR
jgi:hypothetical protein